MTFHTQADENKTQENVAIMCAAAAAVAPPLAFVAPLAAAWVHFSYKYLKGAGDTTDNRIFHTVTPIGIRPAQWFKSPSGYYYLAHDSISLMSIATSYGIDAAKLYEDQGSAFKVLVPLDPENREDLYVPLPDKTPIKMPDKARLLVEPHWDRWVKTGEEYSMNRGVFGLWPIWKYRTHDAMSLLQVAQLYNIQNLDGFYEMQSDDFKINHPKDPGSKFEPPGWPKVPISDEVLIRMPEAPSLVSPAFQTSLGDKSPNLGVGRARLDPAPPKVSGAAIATASVATVAAGAGAAVLVVKLIALLFGR